jgi:chromosomal replication initiator protein
VSKDDRDIVSVVRRALAERLGQDRFDLWFNNGIQLEVEGVTLRVLADNLFGLERLRKAFRTDAEIIARDVLGMAAQVQFAVTAPTPQSRAAIRVAAPVLSEAKEPIASVPMTSAAPAADRARRELCTLDAFVVGESNRLAHAAARSVERRLGQASPLLIHGPTGCGKSHLLEGIGAGVRRTARQSRVVALSAEQFTSYFLEALQGSGLPMFRRKYRDVDLLIIDDVQFFANKKATLVELQHTLDTIGRAGKQLVLSADRPPAELGMLGSELVARISGGLVVDVQTPEEETRYGILQRFAAQQSQAVPEEVLRWLAAQLPGDARQLRGALHRVVASSEAYEAPITLDLAIQATRDLLVTSRRAVQLVDIERAVCNIFGVTPDALQAERRLKKFSLPRSLAMWLARKHTRSALAEIGEYFGRRSHSTVIAAHNNVEKWRNVGETISLTGGACQINDAIKRVEAELRIG